MEKHVRIIQKEIYKAYGKHCLNHEERLRFVRENNFEIKRLRSKLFYELLKPINRFLSEEKFIFLLDPFFKKLVDLRQRYVKESHIKVWQLNVLKIK